MRTQYKIIHSGGSETIRARKVRAKNERGGWFVKALMLDGTVRIFRRVKEIKSL